MNSNVKGVQFSSRLGLPSGGVHGKARESYVTRQCALEKLTKVLDYPCVFYLGLES